MKSILVPLDYSDNARKAYQYGLELARKFEARLMPVHVYTVSALQTGSPYEVVRNIVENEEESQREFFLEYLAELRLSMNHDDVVVQPVLNRGFAVDQIVEVAKRHPDAYIVMGTKGAGGIKEKLLGSNTASVIEQAQCPVFAIPEKASFKPIRNIAYAMPLELGDLETIAHVKEFADLFGATLHCIHVNYTDGDWDIKEIEELDGVGGGEEGQNITFSIIQNKDVSVGINDFIKKRDIDVLAMLTHKRTFMQKLFNKSLTQRFAFHSDVPLLAFHEVEGGENPLF